VRKKRRDEAVLLGGVGVMYSLRAGSPCRPRGAADWKISPLSERTMGVGPLGAAFRSAGWQASSRARSASLARATQGELEADDLAVVAVNHGGQVPHPSRPQGMCVTSIGPALVAGLRSRDHAVDSGPRRGRALVHEPALELEHP